MTMINLKLTKLYGLLINYIYVSKDKLDTYVDTVGHHLINVYKGSLKNNQTNHITHYLINSEAWALSLFLSDPSISPTHAARHFHTSCAGRSWWLDSAESLLRFRTR
jgi:hypothetical protein